MRFAERTQLDSGWEVAGSDGEFVPVRVPGTAATALTRDDFDAEDFTFRTTFAADGAEPGEEVLLHLDGIATVAEVRLNGELILESWSMFEAHAVDVGALLRGSNELEIRCLALAPLLAERRKPRARWRTRVVADGNLRFFRTSILGRAPGFAPGPAPVGPWRPVWLERRRLVAVDVFGRPLVIGDEGVLEADLQLRALGGAQIDAVELELSGPNGTFIGEDTLRIPNVALWWPHTHGEPVLHDVRLRVTVGSERIEVPVGRVGFRTLAADVDDLDLEVNGERVFARGAIWTPVDPVGLAPSDDELRATLERVAAAGMNMLRIPGTGVYESERFHELCDELGILVWQDALFANMDYPVANEEFRARVERELGQVFTRLAAHPSTAIVCGGSEVEQQVSMLGLDPALAKGELSRELIPSMLDKTGSDAVYVPSAPCGGELPFRPNAGVAHYFGVGAYLRPLDDARRAGVRFAAESLAFANVPDDEALPARVVHHPLWKRGVQRDIGMGWDFDDVRDHYLERLFEVDPVELRSVDPERYIELSRQVTGEVIAEVFGEWRRGGSECGGGIVLWLRDLIAGAGWGVLDSRGEPKVAYHHLRRALAPVAVWTVDEGLNGIHVHAANDRPESVRARLRVALYHDLEQRTDEVTEDLDLAPRSTLVRDVEGMLGHFADVAAAYGFGPPAQDAVVATLEREDGAVMSQAFRFPAGYPLQQEPARRLGLEASARELDDGAVLVELATTRLAYGVRVELDGYEPSDDAFSIEPGGSRTLVLRAREPDAERGTGAVTALNMQGRVPIRLESSG